MYETLVNFAMKRNFEILGAQKKTKTNMTKQISNKVKNKICTYLT